MTSSSFSVLPASGFGGNVMGIDLGQATGEDISSLKDVFAEAGVLFFHDQTLNPSQHIEFAERWGTINVNRFFTPVPDFPKIAEVRKEPDQRINIGGGWHTDHSYDDIPALGSMLLAKELPSVGGDTLFASTVLAYEGLSDVMKETLERLSAVHSSRHVFGKRPEMPAEMGSRLGNQQAATQDSIHPVVIEHPLSGKKSLYVNPGFTLQFEGWTVEESEPLLRFLYAHITRPEYTYRHRWKDGSMAFWDNRATWHFAINDYHGKKRLMHRVTLEGEALQAAAG